VQQPATPLQQPATPELVSPRPLLDLDPHTSELEYFTLEEVEHMRSRKARLDSLIDNEDNLSVR
jgi:hypothetical protein